MGKHERQQIEEAEKIIEKILNGKVLSKENESNHWFKHAIVLAEVLKNDFDIIKAKHLGNRYDNTGDILISSSSKNFFIEIKMSNTKEGMGTMANISQDALTENNLFFGIVKSWSKFRNQKHHEKWVSDYLDKFKNYPNKILEIENSVLQKEERARYLRKITSKNKNAKAILYKIHERDKKEKLEYLSYLSKQKQCPEIIKRFFVLITLGVHKKEDLKVLIKQKNFFGEVENLLIYYSNSYGNRIRIKRTDIGKMIEGLLEKFSNFKVIFPKGLTQCKIVGIENKKEIPLLGVVLHWKNIAQGIKTPCLNIFSLIRN